MHCLNDSLLVTGLSLCLVAASSAGLPVAAVAGDAAELKVMTFNIRYGTANDGEDRWEKRRDLVFDVIRRHAPDVVGVQEALRFQLDEIREALPTYDEVGVGRDDGKKSGEYSAILFDGSRLEVKDQGTFWFSDTPAEPGSKSWGNDIPRICTWARFLEKKSGVAFYVYNVHLDHQSQPSRERSAQLLAQRVSAREHPDGAVVTGDFNAGEANPAIRHLTGERAPGEDGEDRSDLPGMMDTFRTIRPGAEEVGTFNGFRGRTGGEKIDYIFAPAWVRTEAAEILRDNDGGRYPSDHFPVVATLRVPRVRRS